MTMARTLKLYKLPDAPATPRLREATPADAPQLVPLINTYLARFRLTQAREAGGAQAGRALGHGTGMGAGGKGRSGQAGRWGRKGVNGRGGGA